MPSTLSLLLFGTVTVVSTVIIPSVEPSAEPGAEPPLIAEGSIESRALPKCDALPSGFHWSYQDVPKMPNPTGYYWRFAELPKDVQDCWNFGPCTTTQSAAALHAVTPGAPRKGN